MITHFLGRAGAENFKHPELRRDLYLKRKLRTEKRIYTVKNDKISRGLK
jgi:hypothetical protein